jgi:acyl-CoA thioesterase-1
MKIHRLRYFLAVPLLILCWTFAWAAAPTVMVFGDSLSSGYGIELSRGWVSLLQRRLLTAGYPHRVVNASISGDTTGGGLARLPAALEQHQPDIVVLELGGNDGLRALPLKSIEENLAAMIEAIQNTDARVVLVEMRIPPNYGPRYTKEFQAIFGELAESFDVALAPFFLEGVAGNPELMQRDGIHPKAEGQSRMLDNVWPVIEEAILFQRGAI